MDSERGPGDVSRHVPEPCCLLTLGGLMNREAGCRGPLRARGASRPPAAIAYLRRCPERALTVQGGGGRCRRHLFSNQYSITKRKIHSLAHFQDEIMGWSNNTQSRRSVVH